MVGVFMGYKFHEWTYPDKCLGITFQDERGNYLGGRWDRYWDDLMPIVEKISMIEIKDCKVICNGEESFFDSYYLRTFGMVSSESKEYLVRINRFPLHSSKSLISATYKAVVEFIKWYNQNNKS